MLGARHGPPAFEKQSTEKPTEDEDVYQDQSKQDHAREKKPILQGDPILVFECDFPTDRRVVAYLDFSRAPGERNRLVAPTHFDFITDWLGRVVLGL